MAKPSSTADRIETFLAALAAHASPATVAAYQHDLAALCTSRIAVMSQILLR